MEEKIFPKNPFEDVNPREFNKLNKKHVTEDFVEENFKDLGWEVFKPFNDTGVDRIISKEVCPKGHTLFNKICIGKCKICNSESIKITRFIQVKTRELKKDIFGFTLKPKDIRIDPRHIYLLYSDSTTDFLIISVEDYLSFFLENNMNPFASNSFRKGNNKLNSLKYKDGKWLWGTKEWEIYRNIQGLIKIQNPLIDKDLENKIEKIRKIRNLLLKKFSKGGTYSKEFEIKVNDYLFKKLKEYENPSNILKERRNILQHLRKEIKNEATFESIKKYWEIIKNLEMVGQEVQTATELKKGNEKNES